MNVCNDFILKINDIIVCCYFKWWRYFYGKKRGEIINEIGKIEELSLENKMVSYRVRYV